MLIRHLHGALNRVRLVLSATECPYASESQSFPSDLIDILDDEPLKTELTSIMFDDIERMHKQMEKKSKEDEKKGQSGDSSEVVSNLVASQDFGGKF